MVDIQCQSCHTRIHLTGLEALRDAANAALPPALGLGGGAGAAGKQQRQPQQPAARLEESFVVLEGARRGMPGHDAQSAGQRGVLSVR